MRQIKSKKQAVYDFLDNTIEELKEVPVADRIEDCILITVYDDGSSEIFHTSMKYSEIVWALRSQEHALFESLK